jgi:hypothetical protein
MTHFTPPLSRAAADPLALRAILLLVLFMVTVLSRGQEAHQWTERENLGFKGTVRTVRTTVARLNPDPRSHLPHKLFVEGHPDQTVFDPAGRRIEFVSASSGDNIVAVSKCAFEADGSKVCNDSAGQQHESTEQRTILPDGSREVTYFQDSKVTAREVTQVDEKGKFVASSVYLNNGNLSSQETKLPDGADEWKIYDGSGVVVSDTRTRESVDKNRLDRWSYDSDGNLVWNLAISSDGDLLSYWYDIGFKPKVSSSGSLGICRPRLCVDYKFDEEGSGRLEKVVQHTQGEGNLEPDSEEHYNFDGTLDERAEINYTRDEHGNWTSRSVFVWDSGSNLMVEIERDTRTVEYY